MNITPGPWATSRDAVPAGHVQITVYAESTGQRIATVFEREENAKAIAAVPSMLNALKAIRARLHGRFDNPHLMEYGPLETDADVTILNIVHAALIAAGDNANV